MRIAANCAGAYAKASDKTRRRFNTAVFKQLAVRDGRVADVEHQEPFDVLFGVPELEYDDLVGVALHNTNRAAMITGECISLAARDGPR